jgi:hypothetical protein
MPWSSTLHRHFRAYSRTGSCGFSWMVYKKRRRVRLLLGAFCLYCAGLVLAAEPPDDPILRIDAGMHMAKIARIAVDPRGQWLVTASLSTPYHLREAE